MLIYRVLMIELRGGLVKSMIIDCYTSKKARNHFKALVLIVLIIKRKVWSIDYWLILYIDFSLGEGVDKSMNKLWFYHYKKLHTKYAELSLPWESWIIISQIDWSGELKLPNNVSWRKSSGIVEDFEEV